MGSLGDRRTAAPDALDLGRVLAEHAALVAATLAGETVLNL